MDQSKHEGTIIKPADKAHAMLVSYLVPRQPWLLRNEVAATHSTSMAMDVACGMLPREYGLSRLLSSHTGRVRTSAQTRMADDWYLSRMHGRRAHARWCIRKEIDRTFVLHLSPLPLDHHVYGDPPPQPAVWQVPLVCALGLTSS